MTYFLDFDRTLFDTDSFLESLPDEPGCASFADELRHIISQGRDQSLRGSPERERIWAKVSEAVNSGTLSFSRGQLTRYLYKDVPEFLRMLGSEVVIITLGDIGLQRAKIESALADVDPAVVLYTGREDKATFLKEWPEYRGGEALCVDDRVPELESLGAAFPSMSLYEMRRDGGIGDGRWPVLHNLNTLL